jgi:hypothetical protein
MKELNAIDISGTYEIAAWLIMLLTMLLGYKYFKEIIEYVMLKLYEYFIQHKF